MTMHDTPSASEHRWCRAAISCGKTFTLPCFTEQVLDSSTGRKRTGAGAMLAQLERAGLAKKWGRKAFGELVFGLTAHGVAAAEADPLEVVEPGDR